VLKELELEKGNCMFWSTERGRVEPKQMLLLLLPELIRFFCGREEGGRSNDWYRISDMHDL